MITVKALKDLSCFKRQFEVGIFKILLNILLIAKEKIHQAIR